MRFPLVIFLIFLSIPAFEPDSRSQTLTYWDLPTGSHIAYTRYPARLPAKGTPVVFLHGGPGAYLVDHPAVVEQFYRSLALLGFDIYIYDQIGSGYSSRLADPRQYTVDRHIQDLEAIRQKIGTDRLILIGDSWGATLGANYIAEHPERCLKAIFSGPGLIDRQGASVPTYEDAPMTQLAEAWYAKIYAQSRYRGMEDPFAANILALYRSISDAEMDAQFDSLIQRALPFLVCDPAKLPSDDSIHGMGWWVNLMTSADFARRRRNPKRVLSRAQVPVLILRGGCDYLRWEVAYQYKAVFPNSKLLYVPNAGHAFGYDQPELYTAAVRAFLLDQPLPVPAYEGTTAPPRVTPKQKLIESE